MKYIWEQEIGDDVYERPLEISYDWQPEQKTDGQEVEPVPAGFEAIYAIDDNDNDKWDDLPKYVQEDIIKKLGQEQRDRNDV
jgi:hypothetical protein